VDHAKQGALVSVVERPDDIVVDGRPGKGKHAEDESLFDKTETK
jgi:hypothetical protein